MKVLSVALLVVGLLLFGLGCLVALASDPNTAFRTQARWEGSVALTCMALGLLLIGLGAC